MFKSTRFFLKDGQIFFISIKSFVAISFLLSVFFKFQAFYQFSLFLGHLTNLQGEGLRIVALSIQATEFFLFFQLMISTNKKYAVYAWGILGIYSIMLIYLIILNKTENCFCYGTFLEMSPIESLLKNFFLSALLYFVYLHSSEFKYEIAYDTIILSVIILFSFFTFKELKNYFTDVHPQSIEIESLSDTNDVVFIDVREKFLYEAGHLPNAVNIPYKGDALSQEVIDTINRLLDYHPERVVVMYCDNSFCGLAHSFTARLLEYFPDKKIFYLKNGYQGWNDFVTR